MSTQTLPQEINGNGHLPAANGASAYGFLAHSLDFLNILKKTPEVENRTENHHTLLKSAYTMLEKAESEIASRDERIKTLENLLTIDELTGLTNRRGFYQAFVRELERTNRGENFGGLLIMIDLDYFKDINDCFGHQAGDEALKLVAQLLQNHMRTTDIAARLGGDEFILLYPNTTASAAINRVKMLEDDLNKLKFIWNKSHIHIKGSIGLREFIRGDSVEKIINDADRLMYSKKRQKKDIMD